MSEQDKTRIVFFIFAVLALVAAFVALTAPAAAHEWYEGRCCSGRDCKPVPNGTVRGTPTGYVILLPGIPPEVVPYNDPRLHPMPPAAPMDARSIFHICKRGGVITGDTLCVYIPDGGA